MSKPPSEELRIGEFGVVYHPERGVLCQAEHHYNGSIFHPIRFNDTAAAHKWIETGTIAELQESLNNLGVGFGCEAWKPRPDFISRLAEAQAAGRQRS